MLIQNNGKPPTFELQLHDARYRLTRLHLHIERDKGRPLHHNWCSLGPCGDNLYRGGCIADRKRIRCMVRASLTVESCRGSYSTHSFLSSRPDLRWQTEKH